MSKYLSAIIGLWWHTVATEICNTKRTFLYRNALFPLRNALSTIRNALFTTERTFIYRNALSCTKTHFLSTKTETPLCCLRRLPVNPNWVSVEESAFRSGKCVSVQESAFRIADFGGHCVPQLTANGQTKYSSKLLACRIAHA